MSSRADSKTTTRRRRSLPAKDPVIYMIARANGLLDESIKAANNLEIAKAKLLDEDRRYPSVLAPTFGTLRGEWHYGFRFTSEGHIDKEFRRASERLREEIKHARRGKRPNTEQIVRNQMVLAMLPKLKGPLKKQFREEEVRLFKVQKKAGLIDCHKERNKASFALRAITDQIAKAKPATTQGALAMIQYVQVRLRSDLAEFFSDNCDIPGQFGRVTRRMGCCGASTKRRCNHDRRRAVISSSLADPGLR
jgi:hypothetical protein